MWVNSLVTYRLHIHTYTFVHIKKYEQTRIDHETMCVCIYVVSDRECLRFFSYNSPCLLKEKNSAQAKGSYEK